MIFDKVPDEILSRVVPNWLTGPIFDKELRIASRRKRYYLLRLVFIAILLILMMQGWMVAMAISHSSSAGFVAMRMSMVSRSVTCAVIWLEFALLPILAVVILSGSISTEINKRTLDVLLTTPITSLQLVMGKVLSCLLQLAILGGVTLPLFAIVRVFGGVPWDYVIASLCVTLTTTCLFGSLSLLYSIRIRQAYQVIVWVLFTMIVVFGFIPAGLSALMHYMNWVWVPPAIDVFSLINPYMGMAEMTGALMNSHSVGTGIFSWKLHCLITSGVFLSLLVLSVCRLRTIMIKFLDFQPKGRLLSRLKGRFGGKKTDAVSDRELIPMTDNAIVWKEMRRKGNGFVTDRRAEMLVLIGLVIAAYVIGIYYHWLSEPGFHAAFVTTLALFGFLRTGVLSAMSISAEKQSRTWPILLTTPISDTDIIKMKIKAIVQKTMLYWIVIIVDVVVFSLCLVLNPLAIIGVLASIIPTVLFLLGMGMYFGMRLKTTTGTIAMTFVIPFVLWLMCPCFMQFNPIVLLAMSVGAEIESGEDYIMPLIMMGGSLIPAIIYGVIGWVMLILTKSSMRKYIFHASGQ